LGELGKKAIHMETAMLVSTNFYICISIWIKKVPNSPDSPNSPAFYSIKSMAYKAHG